MVRTSMKHGAARLLLARQLRRQRLLLFGILAVTLVTGIIVFQLHKVVGGPPVLKSDGGLTPRAKKLSDFHSHMYVGRGPEKSDWFENITRFGKEPEWEVADVLRLALPAMNNPVVPVIVVEEHYEVLKYWFDAVTLGLIPAAGNTLLHIDGHSDSAPPRDMKLVPWFRLPRNHSEVANMMQSNDIFIAGAALAGLIDRYIWVWPEWDRKEHGNHADHEIWDVKAGWRTYFPSEHGEPFSRFCFCMKLRPQPHAADEENDWECWDDEPNRSDPGGGSILKNLSCVAEKTGLIEEVHESKALQLLQEGNWIREDENLLLDIDEDYYGCESSVMPLYRAGLAQSKIDNLSQLMQGLLCVEDVRQEFVADKIFRDMVQIVQDVQAKLCAEKSSQEKRSCLNGSGNFRKFILDTPTYLKRLKKSGFDELACNQRAKRHLWLILHSLFKLSTQQLDALKYVGVCLFTAPTNMMFIPMGLHVCHGFNIPGESAVIFHVPSKGENQARSRVLKETLSLLPKQPELVTVCRSMRDGYTPWAHFGYIENAVFGILKAVFKDVANKSFHFDENLLGKSHGWPDRHIYTDVDTPA